MGGKNGKGNGKNGDSKGTSSPSTESASSASASANGSTSASGSKGSLPRLRDLLRVEPGSSVRLADRDPAATFGYEKAPSVAELEAGLGRLSALQDRLWAEAKRSVLIVLQGIDAAGKDGTIRHVMDAFNPQGCPVTSFKVPTPDELGHDYLWRIHKHTPRDGEIAIFNRSHYEDVLVVRVHSLVPESIWSQRYDQINAFEELLTATGTTVVKFFLHIDKDEQKQRFQERLADPAKHWKFSSSDLAERALWDDYMAAFDAALSRCSTANAPWYVIPSNRNWFRNMAVSQILGDILEELNPQYPAPEPGLADVVVE